MMTVSYARHRFPPLIIRDAAWLDVRFALSLRDVEGLLAERRVDVSYETVRCQVAKFGTLCAADPPVPASFVRPLAPEWVFAWMNGRRMYLWRAVNHE